MKKNYKEGERRLCGPIEIILTDEKQVTVTVEKSAQTFVITQEYPIGETDKDNK